MSMRALCYAHRGGRKKWVSHRECGMNRSNDVKVAKKRNMKRNFKTTFARFGLARLAAHHLLALTLIFLSLSCLLQAQTLEHRYSFATNANDSVGTANGTLVQPTSGAAANISNGLYLPGTGTSGNPSGYVSLPNGIVSGDTSVTVECWVTQAAQQTWAQLWSFGVSGGSANFGLIPVSGGTGSGVNMRVAFIPNGDGEVDIDDTAVINDANVNYTLPAGPEEYVAVTYNNPTLKGNLYTNGTLVGTTIFPSSAYSPGTYTISEDVLGLDPYGGDAQFAGAIYELRIWNGAVSQRYIAASALLGPSNIVTSLNPASVSVTSSNVIATETVQATVTVQIPPTGTTNLVATGDATNWVSGNTNVLTVSSTDWISGVNPGTTTVSATIAGVTGASAPITVLPQVLLHRYSFVSNANDSVGTAHGILQPPTSGTAASINNGLHS
jgi:hypothetical protein